MLNRVVVEDGGHNTIKAGKPDNCYCWRFRYSEEHVVESIEEIDILRCRICPSATVGGAGRVAGRVVNVKNSLSSARGGRGT